MVNEKHVTHITASFTARTALIPSPTHPLSLNHPLMKSESSGHSSCREKVHLLSTYLYHSIKTNVVANTLNFYLYAVIVADFCFISF